MTKHPKRQPPRARARKRGMVTKVTNETNGTRLRAHARTRANRTRNRANRTRLRARAAPTKEQCWGKGA